MHNFASNSFNICGSGELGTRPVIYILAQVVLPSLDRRAFSAHIDP